MRARQLTRCGKAAIAVLLAAGWPVSVAGQVLHDAELIPRRSIFGATEVPFASLGPEGKQLAFVRIVDSERTAWIGKVDAIGESEALRLPPGYLPLALRWSARPETLLVEAVAGGARRLLRYDVEKHEFLELFPGENTSARFVKVSSRLPLEALVAVNDRDSEVFDLWRVDLETGVGKSVAILDRLDRVHVDGLFRPRLAERVRDEGGIELMTADASGGWRPLRVLPKDHPSIQGVLGVDPDGTEAFVVHRDGRDKAALFALDLETGAESLLAEDKDADIRSTAVSNPYTGEVLGVSAHFDTLRRFFLDSAFGADIKTLASRVGGEVGIAGMSADSNVLLVVPFDGGPTRFVVYRRASRETIPLLTMVPALDDVKLARRSAHVVRVRDGLRLPAHLYLPRGADGDGDGLPDEPLPTLLTVHGGPHVAYPWDSWYTNRLLQLLADRGYAALRVEYRGADGFGRQLRDAGYREWGGRAHQDLLDIADWAVQSGVAAKDRICVWGWSYGGYASMAALGLAPEAFACGMSLYGVSSLEKLLATNPEAWRKTLGDERTAAGRALMRAYSPIDRVGEIVRPLLVTHGGRDVVVGANVQTQPLVDRMTELGKPVTYLYYADEPHDYRRSENWVSFWAVAERFLAQHLGGRYEPFGQDLSGATSLEVRAGAEYVPGLENAI